MTRMSGQCMDANDLYWRLGKDFTYMHEQCKYADCTCWHHTEGAKQSKPKPVEGKGRSKKVTQAKQTVATISGQPKLNKDGSVPKKRGRPKGSKNKVKG